MAVLKLAVLCVQTTVKLRGSEGRTSSAGESDGRRSEIKRYVEQCSREWQKDAGSQAESVRRQGRSSGEQPGEMVLLLCLSRCASVNGFHLFYILLCFVSRNMSGVLMFYCIFTRASK